MATSKQNIEQYVQTQEDKEWYARFIDTYDAIFYVIQDGDYYYGYDAQGLLIGSYCQTANARGLGFYAVYAKGRRDVGIPEVVTAMKLRWGIEGL